MYEYVDEYNYSDRRYERIKNEEFVLFDKFKHKIIYETNNLQDAINNIKIALEAEKYNL